MTAELVSIEALSQRPYDLFDLFSCFVKLTMEEYKVKGPASYFPSIEKKYGQPIDHWLKLVASLTDMKHMEKVAFLKSEHGLGHGHANAIVAYVLASRSS